MTKYANERFRLIDGNGEYHGFLRFHHQNKRWIWEVRNRAPKVLPKGLSNYEAADYLGKWMGKDLTVERG